MTEGFPDNSASRLVAETIVGDNAAPLSVGELSAKLKRFVEGEFGHVRLRGEISGYKRAASGHAYFSLKDDVAVIDAIIWKGAAGSLPFSPQDGIEVIATGKLTTYPGRSKYQIVVERMELAGEGALMALLERLKAQLASEGLFDPARKQPLPFLPRVIGVVTSPTGAVIRDILHRLADRFPTDVLIWPVAVQGEGAPAQIAAAVRGFDALAPGDAIPRPDLVIVARGGGSIEDLWAFNDEHVVRAIAACTIPIISAVGHETDTSLSDYAADWRAPTPTAAAEIAVPVRADLIATVDDFGVRVERVARRHVMRLRERLDAIARLLPKREALLGPQRQKHDDLSARLDRALERPILRSRGQLDRVAAILRPAVLDRQLAAARDILARTVQLLDAVNPDGLLRRGYVRVSTRAGASVTTAQQARTAGAVTLTFGDGIVDARVERGSSKAYKQTKPEQPNLF